MKFFIINSFRTIVYVAYFAIIVIMGLGFYIQKELVADIVLQLTGATLDEPSSAAVAIVSGLIWGWFSATLICGLLVTLLDIRDDINDRLPDARGKQ